MLALALRYFLSKKKCSECLWVLSKWDDFGYGLDVVWIYDHPPILSGMTQDQQVLLCVLVSTVLPLQNFVPTQPTDQQRKNDCEQCMVSCIFFCCSCLACTLSAVFGNRASILERGLARSKSSAGEMPVVLCGVILYWKRILAMQASKDFLQTIL